MVPHLRVIVAHPGVMWLTLGSCGSPVMWLTGHVAHHGAMEAHPGDMEARSGAFKDHHGAFCAHYLGQWKLTMESWKLTLYPCRLTLEFVEAHSGSK
jgi:hypothetical protein